MRGLAEEELLLLGRGRSGSRSCGVFFDHRPRADVGKLRLEHRPQGLADLGREPGVPPPAQDVVEGEEAEAEGAVDLGLGGLWWGGVVWGGGGREGEGRGGVRGEEIKKCSVNHPTKRSRILLASTLFSENDSDRTYLARL